MTTSGMRKFTPSALVRPQLLQPKTAAFKSCVSSNTSITPPQSRSLANVRDLREHDFSELWFSSPGPSLRPVEGPGSGLDYKPPDERTLKLGKSMYFNQHLLYE
jgi:hypothetical protein